MQSSPTTTANSSDDVIVALRTVTKSYPLGKTVVHAVRGVSLEIRRGEFSAIAGPSGSGKTTLLNMIGCVDVSTTGDIIVAGQRTNELTDKALTQLRLFKVGFIFQTFNLVPVLTAYQNVEFPLLLQKQHTKAERDAKVRSLMDEVGLSDRLQNRPGELSGGQRQRVAVARALVTEPAIVLADEPTANLDTETGNNIIDLMKRINSQRGTTFIFSTHDPKVIRRADRVVWLEDGKIAETPESLLMGH
ncbi:MAG: ABC transporter ATP-binding protein [Myxococcota bacterium]|nr:ABC transporter ATP-binding protein [Myxococcota bacterium]